MDVAAEVAAAVAAAGAAVVVIAHRQLTSCPIVASARWCRLQGGLAAAEE